MMEAWEKLIEILQSNLLTEHPKRNNSLLMEL